MASWEQILLLAKRVDAVDGRDASLGLLLAASIADFHATMMGPKARLPAVWAGQAIHLVPYERPCTMDLELPRAKIDCPACAVIGTPAFRGLAHSQACVAATPVSSEGT